MLYNADIKVDDTDLVVHFIDVGQGDAIAIKFPNEQVMLIDSGPKISQNKLVKYLQNDVMASNKDLVIDYVEHLRPNLVLERFVSQSPKELLIAPDWGLKNHEFTDKVKKRMRERGSYQGKCYL